MPIIRSLPRCSRQTQWRIPAAPLATASSMQTQTLHKASCRNLHTTRPALLQSRPPKSRDRGPKSNEDTQTDFSALDVLRNTATPATAIDACTSEGFALNNRMRINGSGLLLIGGEAFRWRPWLQEGASSDDGMTGKLLNAKHQWHVRDEAWGLLELVYPKPGEALNHNSSSLQRDTCSRLHNRPSHHRHWSNRRSNCARCSSIFEWPWHTARNTRYKERFSSVQSSRD